MYDVKCDALARHFLRDAGLENERLVTLLAQTIQDTIEDELRAIEADHQEPFVNGPDTNF